MIRRSATRRKVRLGIAGIGNMGSYHARVVADGEIPDCELAAVCDLDPARLTGFPGARSYRDSGAMIASGEIDAILVATPHRSHEAIGVAALKAGLHVLMEKPLGSEKSECERLIAAHHSKKQVFAAMFNQRTDPYYRKIRELVRGGELGAIRRIQWTITDWFRTEAYYQSSDWRATWAGEGGGVLLNQSVHNLDLFQWIFGMPSKVRSLCHLGRYHDIEVEDDVAAIFEYPDLTTAVFTTSSGEAPGTNRLEIAAERGRLVLEGNRLQFRRNEIPMSKFGKSCPEGYLRPPSWEAEIPLPADRGGQHRAVLANFVGAILDGTPLIAPAAEGIHSVELINAILMASHLDRTVDLPISSSAYGKLLAGWAAKPKVKKKVVRSKKRAWSKSHDFGAVSRHA